MATCGRRATGPGIAGSGDYIWVPGTWVMPPSPGLLWTPGYWGFINGGYGWHRGYWGPHVGYYGGLNYGYGYTGSGYWGGRWDRGHFRYNSAVNNLPSGRVHNVYRTPVAQRPPHQESFTGGNSHYRTPPTANERRFEGPAARQPDARADGSRAPRDRPARAAHGQQPRHAADGRDAASGRLR